MHYLKTLFILAFLGFAFAAPPLVPYHIANSQFLLPENWQIQSNDYSIIAYENPNDTDAAILGLLAFVAQAGMTASAEQIADSVLEGFALESQGIRAELLDSNSQNTALYRLYRLISEETFGYLSSYSYVDSASGSIYYLFFTALQDSFVAYGGPALPLVAFAGMDKSLLEYSENTSTPVEASSFAESCETKASSATSQAEALLIYQECAQDMQRAYALMSQISAMSHETSMKIIYNMGGGWCYAGESGCD